MGNSVGNCPCFGRKQLDDFSSSSRPLGHSLPTQLHHSSSSSGSNSSGSDSNGRPSWDYPASWAKLSETPTVHAHFAADLPSDWKPLFQEVIGDVFRILGGGFEIHVFATHTQRQPPGQDAKRVLSEAKELYGETPQPGDYSTFSYIRPERLMFLQYDTICEAHRRSVIAHEYMHIHQLTHVFEMVQDDEFPMWLKEGSCALFEHLYINEYWASLHRDGVREAILHTHHHYVGDKDCWCSEHSTGSLQFDVGKEDYSTACVNYYHETCACLYLASKYALFDNFYVLVTQFWVEAYADKDWRVTFARLFGMTPLDFYAELSAFLARPLDEKLAILPQQPVLCSCQASKDPVHV